MADKNSKSIKLLIIQVLLTTILFLYILLRNNGAPILFFWPIFWLNIIVSLFIVLQSEKKYKIMSLIVLEISLSCIFLAANPYSYQMSRDVYFESEYAGTIINEGRWNPTSGVGFAENYYGYNPVLHFMLSVTSVTTGLTTYALSKYVFFVLLRVILVLSVLLLVSEFVKENRERMIYLAIFIFIASFGMSFIEISRRLIASIFLMFALYAIIKGKNDSEKKVWNALFYVFSAIVIISNHSIAYLLILILFSIWLYGLITKTRFYKRIIHNKESVNKNYPGVLQKLFYVLFVFLIWEIFVSFILLNNDLMYFLNIFKLVRGGYGIKLLFSSVGSSAATFIYRLYETRTLYLYHLAFVLLGSIGLFIFINKLKGEASENKTKNKNLLLFFGIFSLVMYVLGFALIRTELDSAAYTFLWFFCISISLFIAYLIDDIYSRHIDKNVFFFFLIVFSILFYTGHVFSGIYTPRVSNRAPDENIVIGMDMRAKSPELYYSAIWLSKNTEKNSTMIGDINVFEIYSGLFEFDVSTDEYKQRIIYNGTIEQVNEVLLDRRTYFGSYEHTVRYEPLDYIILDKKFYEIPNYIFGKPLKIEKLEQLDRIEMMDKIYENDEIIIYMNLASEKS